MLRFIMFFCLMVATAPLSYAQTNSKPKKLNTQLYEQEPEEDKEQSFSAKVRVVREVSDEVEVFFESDSAKGAYTLPHSTPNYATVLKDLEKSRAPHGPQVTVKADSEKRIKSVTIQEVPAKKSKNPYDPGEIPDI
ncbi:MAG: hypothetical protein ACM3MG_00790 [Bacillota bacterium]